jgi:hypothetical protein
VQSQGASDEPEEPGKAYHGTDSNSAASIEQKGLNQSDWRAAAGGAGPDPKGFSVTTDRATAEAWAKQRAAERGGDPVVLQAERASLPLQGGRPGAWADPDEFFVAPKDFSRVGPGVFTEE